MYPPKIHQDNRKDHIIEVIKTYPLATLISVDNNLPIITHLPLIYDNGLLIGHIDIYNPQLSLLKDNQPVTVIFSGPQCYISPSIYSTTQLPTWNYIKVHITGSARVVKDKKALKSSLITMTELLESPNPKYVLKPDNPRMKKNLDYIEMFEISITNWEGKFKLSQDKKPKDMKAAREELSKIHQKEITRFLDKIFEES